jgi:hypothetical protein
VDGHVEVVRTGEDFIGKCSEDGFGADIEGLVDDGCYGGVFVEEDLADEVFVWEVWNAEVEVCLLVR